MTIKTRRHFCLQAVQAFVRQAMGYIEQTPDKDTKLELIKTLQTVTEGKVRLPSLDLLSRGRNYNRKY